MLLLLLFFVFAFARFDVRVQWWNVKLVGFGTVYGTFFSFIVVIRCHRRDYSLVIGLLLPYMPIINNITQSNIYSDQNFERLICNNCFRYTVFSFGICNLCEQIIYGATTGTKTTKIICWNRFTCVDCICVPCGMLRLSCLRAMAAGTSNLAGHHTHCR